MASAKDENKGNDIVDGIGDGTVDATAEAGNGDVGNGDAGEAPSRPTRSFARTRAASSSPRRRCR